MFYEKGGKLYRVRIKQVQKGEGIPPILIAYGSVLGYKALKKLYKIIQEIRNAKGEDKKAIILKNAKEYFALDNLLNLENLLGALGIIATGKTAGYVMDNLGNAKKYGKNVLNVIKRDTVGNDKPVSEEDMDTLEKYKQEDALRKENITASIAIDTYNDVLEEELNKIASKALEKKPTHKELLEKGKKLEKKYKKQGKITTLEESFILGDLMHDLWQEAGEDIARDVLKETKRERGQELAQEVIDDILEKMPEPKKPRKKRAKKTDEGAEAKTSKKKSKK